jgi:hypothetical protein
MDPSNSLFIFKSTNHENQVIIDIPNQSITGAVLEDEDFQELVSHANTDLHFHDSDRDRSNHQGTQLSSTISDISTTISNNSDVSSALSHSQDSTIHLSSTQKTGLTDSSSTTLHTHDASNIWGINTLVTNLIDTEVQLPNQDLDTTNSPSFANLNIDNGYIKSSGDLKLMIDSNSNNYTDKFSVSSNTTGSPLDMLSMSSQGFVKLRNCLASGDFSKTVQIDAYSDDTTQVWRIGNTEDIGTCDENTLHIMNAKSDADICISCTNSSGTQTEVVKIDKDGMTPTKLFCSNIYVDSSIKIYDYGNWTPTIGGSSGGFMSGSYTYEEVGLWTRCFSMVTLEFMIEYLNDGSKSGNLLIGNIPFLKYNTGLYPYLSIGTCCVTMQNLSPSGDQVPFALCLNDSWTYMAIIESYDNSNYSYVPIDRSTSCGHPNIKGTITYRCREY